MGGRPSKVDHRAVTDAKFPQADVLQPGLVVAQVREAEDVEVTSNVECYIFEVRKHATNYLLFSV